MSSTWGITNVAHANKSRVHPFGREHFMCQGWKCYRSATLRSKSQVPTQSKAYKYWCYTCYERHDHTDLPHETDDLDDDLEDGQDDDEAIKPNDEKQAASSSSSQCARKVAFEEDVLKGDVCAVAWQPTLAEKGGGLLLAAAGKKSSTMSLRCTSCLANNFLQCVLHGPAVG